MGASRGTRVAASGRRPEDDVSRTEILGPSAMILRGFLEDDEPILRGIEAIAARAPFRHMVTPGNRSMSVAMTNCGPFGWVSDRSGYRYSPTDPETNREWPAMPRVFLELAVTAAAAAGFAAFAPDACLINLYVPRTRLSLHQDKDERDFAAPIVSVSLGLPATFLFGGLRRADRPRRYGLEHGDVVVWGGESRRFFHGVAPLADGLHARLGRRRINLTFRKAR
jgi:alkylated DNA repair protein (DNA oxidative demethylase)